MADDISSLPDVDLGPVIADLEAGQDKGTEKVAETGTEGNKDAGLAQFKDSDALLKGYKELQGFSTKVSQENKALAEKVASLEEDVSLAQTPSYVPPQQGQDFEQMYYDDPKAAIDNIVEAKLQNQRIADVLEAEGEKDESPNQSEFMERYAWAQQVARDPKHAHLASTPQGVRQLFKKGDKLRKEGMKRNASSAMSSIFGRPLTDEETSKLKGMILDEEDGTKTNNTKNNAYMPDISSTVRTGSDSEQVSGFEAQTNEAEAKGDVDGVLQGLFDAAMAK